MEDNFLMEHGEKLGLPFSSCMVLYCKVIQDNIGLDYGKIRDFLTRFASIDKDKDGWITPQDMADFLSVSNDTCLQALFKNQDNEVNRLPESVCMVCHENLFDSVFRSKDQVQTVPVLVRGEGQFSTC